MLDQNRTPKFQNLPGACVCVQLPPTQQHHGWIASNLLRMHASDGLTYRPDGTCVKCLHTHVCTHHSPTRLSLRPLLGITPHPAFSCFFFEPMPACAPPSISHSLLLFHISASDKHFQIHTIAFCRSQSDGHGRRSTAPRHKRNYGRHNTWLSQCMLSSLAHSIPPCSPLSNLSPLFDLSTGKIHRISIDLAPHTKDLAVSCLCLVLCSLVFRTTKIARHLILSCPFSDHLPQPHTQYRAKH